MASGGVRGDNPPLGFIALEHLALRVVADNLGVDEAAQVELLRPEHRHLGGCRVIGQNA